MSNDNLALLAAAAYGKFDNIQDLSEIRSKLIIEGLSKDQAKVFTDTVMVQSLATF